jgi:hypothetical protein
MHSPSNTELNSEQPIDTQMSEPSSEPPSQPPSESPEPQNDTLTISPENPPQNSSDSSSQQQQQQQEQDPNPNPTLPRKRRRRKKFFTELTATTSLSKTRKNDVAKDCDDEALIAISVGFPVDSLTEEEIEANVVKTIGGSEQSNYIIVRNHILARWRSDVNVWLTYDKAVKSIRSEHKGLVDVAYRFLIEHGYINFGVSPEIKAKKNSSFDGIERGSVIVPGWRVWLPRDN